MPEPTPTLVHYDSPSTIITVACGTKRTDAPHVSRNPGEVTCFACRNHAAFKQAQEGVGGPTPPIKLSGVMATDDDIKKLTAEALKGCRNERGMYVIEEFIHHGDYRSKRRVEVYSINAVTVDAVLQSSPYCYGSWLHPDNPDHKQVRNTHLHQLVEDLRNLRTNRAIGWSTFRIITPEEN